MPRILVIALAAVCLTLACSDDGAGPANHDDPIVDPINGTKEWHVPALLQLAYDNRNVAGVAELLDEQFEFYFDSYDVVRNGAPEKWGRAEEMQATTGILTSQPGKNNNPVVSIDVTIFDVEDVAWEDVTDDPSYPGETLRRATVVYDFYIDTEQDMQFITEGAPRARLTIRNVEGKWKLVRWDDEKGGTAQRLAPGSTEKSTWGLIKFFYEDSSE